MAEIIKLVALLAALGGILIFAIGVSHLGDIIDNISWFYGKVAALMLYSACYIMVCAALRRYDLMDMDVDGLNGFRVYWLYGFVGMLIPVIGTARVAAFVSTFVFVISMGWIIYG